MDRPPPKYTQLVKRRLRAQEREEHRLAMRADAVDLGVVLLGAIFATVVVGNCL